MPGWPSVDEAGIHLLGARRSRRPGFIGGSMLANFPVRLVGMVASKDEGMLRAWPTACAEKPGGRGDFLLALGPRFQAAWLAVGFRWRSNSGEPQMDTDVHR
ncbi:MAG: hypothetical protein R2838_03285 [Caldilineaceae bacterium]